MYLHELDYIMQIPKSTYTSRTRRYIRDLAIVRYEKQYYTIRFLAGHSWKRIQLYQGKSLKYKSCNGCTEILRLSRYRTNANTCRRCERKQSLIPRMERHNEKGKGFVSAAEMREIAARFTNCGYCARPLKKDLSNVHIDHFIPYRLGGQNIASNIIICCQYCNHAKHSHDFYEWVHDYFGHYSRSLVDEVIDRVETYFKTFYIS